MKKISTPSWSCKVPLVSPALKDWLLYRDSFMTRLKTFGILDANVEVLNESWQIPNDWEAHCLQSKQEKMLIREVIIRNPSQYFMFARTVMTNEILSGELQELSRLNSRSLGSVLFSHPNVIREEFEFAELYAGMPFFDQIIAYLPYDYTDSFLPARRSVFSLREKKLILTEVFFPKATPYV